MSEVYLFGITGINFLSPPASRKKRFADKIIAGTPGISDILPTPPTIFEKLIEAVEKNQAL